MSARSVIAVASVPMRAKRTESKRCPLTVRWLRVQTDTSAYIRQYCSQMVGTYNGKFNKEGPAKGDKSYGGYANYNRYGMTHEPVATMPVCLPDVPQISRKVRLQDPRRPRSRIRRSHVVLVEAG